MEIENKYTSEDLKIMQASPFDKTEYHIKQISYQQAMEIVIEKHYLHRRCPCSIAFGLFRNNTEEIMGVVTYGVPCSSTLLRGICGNEQMHNIYELNRLWVNDDVPKNGESFLIGNTLKKLDKEIIVSFADSSQGHIGYVYQSTNWLYCGLSAKFRDPKVKGLENQHHATYAHGMTMSQVIEKYGADNVYYVDRPRKHRYIYFNCRGSKRKKLEGLLRYDIMPYPKSELLQKNAC